MLKESIKSPIFTDGFRLVDLLCQSYPPHCVVLISLNDAERERERVLFIGTQFSILYTSIYSPAEAATPRA
jgi:hypothetical protein